MTAPTTTTPEPQADSAPTSSSQPEKLTHLGIGRFERLLILRTFPAYSDLPPETLAAIAQNTRQRFYPRGSYIYREGEPVTTVSFIIQGQVTTRKAGRVLGRYGRRHVVGGLSVLAQDPEGYDCVAEEDTLVLQINAEDNADVFEDNFEILRNILRVLAGQIIDLRLRMGDTAGFSGEIQQAPCCPPRSLDLVERMALLRRSITFGESKIDAIADLAREAKEVRVDAGVELWRKGDLDAHFYLVVEGTIEGSVGDKTFRFGPGDVAGALDAFAERPRWFTARSGQGLIALRQDRDAFLDVLEDNHDMALDFVRVLARGYLQLSERFADLGLTDEHQPADSEDQAVAQDA